MPDDYPDWLKGFDPWEASRRTLLGLVGGDTGIVVWGSSFEDGMAEWSFSGYSGLYANLSSEYAYHGAMCLRMGVTGVGGSASVYRSIGLYAPGRFGVELYVAPGLTYAGTATEFTMVVHLHGNGLGTRYTNMWLKVVSAVGSDAGRLWLYTASGWDDTGIDLRGWASWSGLSGNPWWHQLKWVFRVDTDGAVNCHLLYDGVKHDLSSYSVQINTDSYERHGIYLRLQFASLDAPSKLLYADAVTITKLEP